MYFFIRVLFVVLLSVLVLASGPSLDPTRYTVTQTAGFQAVLPCTVKNLNPDDQSIKVLWLGPSDKLLTYGKNIVTSDSRIKLRRPYENDWNLHIENVKYSDRGEYKCQVTTNPVQSRTANLHVRVSPRIVEKSVRPSSDIIENSDVTLICNVTGVPKPKVSWLRKTKENPNVKDHLGEVGEILTIQNITRDQSGTYECVATNDVPPPATEQIKIDVQYPPGITIQTSKITQTQGRTTVLECTITGYPIKKTVWKFHDRDIVKSWKYKPEALTRDKSVLLSLEIIGLEEGDFGHYTCYAENGLGYAAKQVLLEEFKVTNPNVVTTTKVMTTTRPVTTTTETSKGTMTTSALTSEERVTSSSSFSSTGGNENLIIHNGNETSIDDFGYTLRESGRRGQGTNSGSSLRGFFGAVSMCCILVIILL